MVNWRMDWPPSSQSGNDLTRASQSGTHTQLAAAVRAPRARSRTPQVESFTRLRLLRQPPGRLLFRCQPLLSFSFEPPPREVCARSAAECDLVRSALLPRLSCQARSPPDNTQARPRTKHTHLSVCLFVTRTSAKQRAMSWPGWLAGCPAKTIRTVGESGRKGAGLARDIQAWPVRRLTQTRKTHSQIHVLVLGPVGNVALPRALTAVRNSGNVRRCLKCRHLHRLTYALAPMAHICIEVRNGARVRATRNKRALRLVRCVHVSAPASVWACVRVCGNPSGSSCEKSSI